MSTFTFHADTLPLDLLLLDDTALDRAIHAADAAANAASIAERLRAEKQERQDRRAADLARLEALIGPWEAQVPTLHEAYTTLLVAVTNHSSIDPAHLAGRTSYALKHDLNDTHPARFPKPVYSVDRDLIAQGGEAARRYLLVIRHSMPPIERPWADDLREAKRLVERLALRPKPKIKGD